MEWWGWGDGVLGLGRCFVGTREMVVGAGEVAWWGWGDDFFGNIRTLV